MLIYDQPFPHSMAKSKESSGLDQAPACKGCFKWNIFGKKCWFYWDLKKICSQWEASANQAPPSGPQQPLPKGMKKPKAPAPKKP